MDLVPMTQQFASDNNAGMCPVARDAVLAANAAGHSPGYGDDAWTGRAKHLIQELLEAPAAAVAFVFNGTAANALALAHVCRPYHAVIAHAASHIATDEAGAPGFFTGGSQVLTADGPDAKLTPAALEALARGGRGVHHVKPRVVSLTQATELGTVYTIEQLRCLSTRAHDLGLAVHMDGARLANAVVSLGCAPADITWRAGVDLLSLGGVKNGLAVGEAIVVFDPAQADELAWRIKQSGHLNAKMRFVTAPWVALIERGAWLANAAHANAMAKRLADQIQDRTDLTLLYPVEANAVFVDIPVELQARLRDKGWRFYTFLGATDCRLMCAWDTEPATVDRFVAALVDALAGR